MVALGVGLDGSRGISCDGISHAYGIMGKAPGGVEAVIQTAPVIMGLSRTLDPMLSRMLKTSP